MPTSKFSTSAAKMATSETAALLSTSTSDRRGSITQMALPNFKLARTNSFRSINDSRASLTSFDSFQNYGSTEQENLIQSRRQSMLTTKLSHARLAPITSNDSSHIPEVETSTRQEVHMLLQSSIALIITFMLQYSLTIASVFSVGQLGARELAAVSLSNLLVNITSYGIIQGIASSLSTLCPQAYGRKDYKSVGLHALRCTVLLFAVFIPIFIFLYWGSYPLLNAVVPDPALCKLASQYLRRLVFGVPGFIIFEVLKQYLQAQGIFHASTYVLVICAPVNVLLNVALVWDKTIGMGFIGAPTAVLITNWAMAIMLLFYAFFVNGYQCWCGFTTDVFQNWGRTLRLAGPGVLMIEAEWLAFEIITFAASRFGTTSLAAQSIVSTTCVTIYQVSFAISVASSTRIAWFVGSASKYAALKSTKASLILAACFGSMNGLLLFSFRSTIASWFSKEGDVIELASRTLTIGAIYQIMDSMSCVTGGVLRGQGRQYIGGYINLVSYYAIALPVAFLCAFHFNLGLFGLWIGMLFALSFITFSELFFVLTSDWDCIISQSIEDGVVEHHLHHNDEHPDECTNLLVPTKSVGSLIEHNMMSPSISASTGNEIGAVSNLNI